MPPAAQPVNNATNALGVMYRKVRVEQIVSGRGVAIVRDEQGFSTEVPYRVQSGRGRLPSVGEYWYVDRSMGVWTFSSYIAINDDDLNRIEGNVVVTGDFTVTGGTLVGEGLFITEGASVGTGLFVGEDAFVTGQVHAVEGVSTDGSLTVTGGATISGDLSVTGVGQRRYIKKSAPQTRTSNTLGNADDMSFSVVANAVYKVELRVAYNVSDATSEFKMAWTGPSGFAMDRNILTPSVSGTSNESTAMASIRRSAGTEQIAGGMAGVTSEFTVWWEDIILTIGATAGTVQLQFARSTGTGTAEMKSNSYILVTRIA